MDVGSPVSYLAFIKLRKVFKSLVSTIVDVRIMNTLLEMTKITFESNVVQVFSKTSKEVRDQIQKLHCRVKDDWCFPGLDVFWTNNLMRLYWFYNSILCNFIWLVFAKPDVDIVDSSSMSSSLNSKIEYESFPSEDFWIIDSVVSYKHRHATSLLHWSTYLANKTNHWE